MKSQVKEDIQIEINNDIFKYLEPSSNILLSEISNSDKVYMMYLLKQYYLELRNKLGLSENITFGLEIEFEEAYRDLIETEIDNLFDDGDWAVVDDESLSNGGEINSPKLTDIEKTWIDLKTVCDIVDNNAYVMDNTGGHIHIGMHILGDNPKYWANFVKLWMTYENIIFRFLYGEYASHRSRIVEQARPISRDLINNLYRINDRTKYNSVYHMFKVLDAGDSFKERRKRAVNFTNVSELQPYKYNSIGDKNTVEFRSPNGTFDPVIWQNNVNFLTKMMLYCKSNKFNEDILNKRMFQIMDDDIASKIYKYSRIYMEQAIELADLIFDNNLDKIYFLRQYIKSGEVSTEAFVKSRKFTRK